MFNLQIMAASAALLVFSNGYSYLKGASNGYEKRSVEAEAEKAAGYVDVLTELEILRQQRELFEKEQRELNERLGRQLRTDLQHQAEQLQGLIQDAEPIEIDTDCRVSYDTTIGVLDDAADGPASNGDRSGETSSNTSFSISF